MSTALLLACSPELLPAPLFAPTPAAWRRAIEFFTAQIDTDHDRKAYFNATRRSFGVRTDTACSSSPTVDVMQDLAAPRMLSDRLMTSHVIDENPAHVAPQRPQYPPQAPGSNSFCDADFVLALRG